MKLQIDPAVCFQPMEGFGASGAWWAQNVGGWTDTDPDSGMAVRDRISQLLHDPGRGIGLTIYRYNLGSGSRYITKGDYAPFRRTDTFAIGGGKYDMTRDANAVYMMKQAVRDGAKEVIFFVNSPPVWLTKNGGGHQDKNKHFRENLSPKNYGAFADYCLDIASYFLADGVPLRYFSPVNEPIWQWNGGQEGCFYLPHSVRRVFHVFCEKMDARTDLGDMKLSGCESGDLRFFNKTYTRFLLSDPLIRRHLDAIDVHSYCLPAPVLKKALSKRTDFARRFAGFLHRYDPGLPIRMSEWCHMQGGTDKGMASGLVTAQTIWEDLTVLGAVSWQHWVAVAGEGYCDGLIYIRPDHSFSLTKRYFVTGNFSKYIRPGAVRVLAKTDDDRVKALAYKKDGKVTAVVINPTRETVPLCLEAGGEILAALTDGTHDLSESIVRGGETALPPESVMTLVAAEEQLI